VQRTERHFGTTSATAVQLIVHKKSHATRNSTLLESVDWSVVSRPRPSANYSIVAMVPKRWSIACKAANESIISFQWIHNGFKCIGMCKRQEQSRHSPLHRSVPTGIASWLTWRRTRRLQLLRLVSRQTNNLSCSNQEIDKISVPGQNPSILDRGLLDFLMVYKVNKNEWI
jgi:hypothetical protein